MKALLVYPQCPDTFWSFKHALKFISKKAIHPPLGLLTVAAMLPEPWEKKVVDMNVEPLKDRDLDWADMVFISAMAVQQDSVREVLSRCRAQGVKTVAGGPLFTASHDLFEGVDHFVLNEAEVTLPMFLDDLETGRAKSMYASDQFPGLADTPRPMWGLIDMKKYVSMSIQYSRGCPYDCEFCDITTLFGRRVRTKTSGQLIAELEALRRSGWRGNVFLVDDNFIGNKSRVKQQVLPAITRWMAEHRRPFVFSTEASIDLADDQHLMKAMVRAGFDGVFVGIETPDENSLKECDKRQNTNRNLVQSVQEIQSAGLQVRGGFIVGFDNDTPSIFDRQVSFIQKSGIITAMVGMLNAPRGSRLYRRIKAEGRLIEDVSGDNTDLTINFLPRMGSEALREGYNKIIQGIYSAKPYYERVKAYLVEYKSKSKQKGKFHFGYIRFHFGYTWAIFKSVIHLGIIDKARVHYWKLFWWSLLRKPSSFPQAISYAIYGYHFRKYYGQVLNS